ncbi:cytochrome P450 307a1-like [Homarus americanus]|uniref:cytochrome P450 307a1-like n=1 Tax=Homarus americanus TaxID=6706 RepID=UPI001C437151|nr:cytochrome P450 307a1-like [Homarus americanus]
MVFVLAPATILLMMMVLVAVAVQETIRRRRKQQQFDQTSLKPQSSDDLEIARPSSPPGPTPIPFIGNLHNLFKYDACPYEGFTALGNKYGPVYSLLMGSCPSVVVGTYETIKEVLITKASQFDARPDIPRFGLYFGGNRQLSLALCDWSQHQKKRITLARSFLMFRGNDTCFKTFEENVTSEMPVLTKEIDQKLNTPFNAKELLSYCAMNIFCGYMCSKKFDYNEAKFQELVKNFDFIFNDINNGHPTDFLPSLIPFFGSYLNKIKSKTADIRKYILDNICREKYHNLQQNPKNITDLVDACFSNLLNENNQEEQWDWQTILYIVEDLLGGSSAIGNIVMRFLGYILQHPNVVTSLRSEIDAKLGRDKAPTLENRHEMLYSQAVLYEVLRLTSSPIVPHVATEDATIGGFFVEKGSMVIVNNYEMNSSPDLWDEPQKFKPERFIVDGCLKKPAHFIPFSTGKRACVGSKVVSNITFIVITTLLQRYDISLPEGVKPDLPRGKISVPWDAYDLVFTERK